jgi:acetyl-CoA carboxylase biotin carboxyl carrier protein
MSALKPNASEAAWIRELAAILDQTGLTEIEIQKPDMRVRVSRTSAAATIAYAPAAGAPAAGA